MAAATNLSAHLINLHHNNNPGALGNIDDSSASSANPLIGAPISFSNRPVDEQTHVAITAAFLMGGIPPEIVRLATGRDGAPTDEELRDILQNLPTKAGKRDDPPPAAHNINNQPQAPPGLGFRDAEGTESPILPDRPQEGGVPAAANLSPPAQAEAWTPAAPAGGRSARAAVSELKTIWYRRHLGNIICVFASSRTHS